MKRMVIYYMDKTQRIINGIESEQMNSVNEALVVLGGANVDNGTDAVLINFANVREIEYKEQ